jgi:citrate lyase subunit beta/citryl-CoA lyase
MTAPDPAVARTFLFVPGDRPERFDKAAAVGADVVIVDLEDAVKPDAKAAAREAVGSALRAGARVAVRISAAGTPDFDADLELLLSAPLPVAVIAAKAEDPEQLARIAELGSPVIALIESARGVAGVADISGVSGVTRLAFGAIDFTLDVGATMDPALLGHVRSQLVIHSRAAGIASPLDSPTLDFTDLRVVRDDTRAARALGMGGKLCIHPAQVAVAAEAFAPTAEELDSARRIVAASTHDGAVATEGSLVDRPVLEKARRLLAAAVHEQRTE